MSDYRTNTPDDDGDGTPEQGSAPNPVPRDMPDQQTGADEDPWELDDSAITEADEGPDPDVPDTDEAGTGKRGGTPHSGGTPEDPAPDESPA